VLLYASSQGLLLADVVNLDTTQGGEVSSHVARKHVEDPSPHAGHQEGPLLRLHAHLPERPYRTAACSRARAASPWTAPAPSPPLRGGPAGRCGLALRPVRHHPALQGEQGVAACQPVDAGYSSAVTELWEGASLGSRWNVLCEVVERPRVLEELPSLKAEVRAT